MLDKSLYQLCETTSVKSGRCWPRPGRAYHAFFYPISMLPQLRSCFNTCNDGFQQVIEEEGGLTTDEQELLVDVLEDLGDFQQSMFSNHKPIAPLSNLLIAYSAYKKIARLCPNLRSILDVNPGSSLLPFFIKREFPNLGRYCTTESEQTLYLLQHYVNSYVFGPKFDQRLYSDVVERLNPPSAPSYTVKSGEKVSVQYPWWQTWVMEDKEQLFDLVLSNANILDITPENLCQYLGNLKKMLAPQGVIFAHGITAGTDPWVAPKPTEQLLNALYEAKLAPLFIGLPQHSKGHGAWSLTQDEAQANVFNGKRFNFSYLVLISENHKLFSQYYKRENFTKFFCAPEREVTETFFGRERDAKPSNESDLLLAFRQRQQEVKNTFNPIAELFCSADKRYVC